MGVRSYSQRVRTWLSRFWVDRKRRRQPIPSLVEVLDRTVAEDSTTSDEPVFILGTGWRVGSTLLQRLVISSGEVLVWGEPHTLAMPIQEMSRMIAMLGTAPDSWFIHDDDGVPMTDKFIANLYPPAVDLLGAHRSFYQAWLGDPAIERGFGRWGVKEVRWGIDDARYLRALFPCAKFVFLTRSPYDAYASYHGALWYGEWPNSIRTVGQFADHWRLKTEQLWSSANEVGALTIRYEDLRDDPQVLDGLDAHLGISIDRNVLDNKVGSTAKGLTSLQRRIIQHRVGAIARELGY